jgi:putative aldouronate transport system permease protein
MAQVPGEAVPARSKSAHFFRKMHKQRFLYYMSVPFVIWLLVFAYVPLLGWSYAFINYNPGKPIFSSQFVGFKFFAQLFQDSEFYMALKNTVIMSVLGLIFGTVCAILFAVVLNEVRSVKYKRTIQTISYLPHFVSWAVLAGMVIQFLSPTSGTLNSLLLSLGIIKSPINFMGVPGDFYAIFTSANLWKELGWSTIIYISAMSGIDMELYEAASADGAGRLSKIWHITLPGIRNTIIILLIMGIGGIVNGGMEGQMLLTNATNSKVTEVLGLYTLNYGIKLQRFSFGTASSIVTSIMAFLLVFTANSISKKLSDQSLF